MKPIILTEYPTPLRLTDPLVEEFLPKARCYDTGDDYTATAATPAMWASSQWGMTPIRLTWQCADPAAVRSVTVKASVHPDLRDAIIRNTRATGSIHIANLFTGTTYYWQVTAHLHSGEDAVSDIGTFTTAPGIRQIRGPYNCRDMGGWQTADGITLRQGLVYRSAHMHMLTARQAHAVQKQLHIRTEIELRPPEEIPPEMRERSALCDEVTYFHRQCNTCAYAEFFDPANGENVGEIVRVFGNPDNYPILYHCAGGADRTGTLALALGALLGVAENDLAADYELTPDRPRSMLQSTIPALKALPGDTLREKVYRYFEDACGVTAAELDTFITLMRGE